MATAPQPEMVATPPMNIPAERTVLGSCLIDNRVIDLMLATLRAEMFYPTSHQEIYCTIEALHREQAPVDVVSVAEWLERHGKLDVVGGAAYLAGFREYVLTTSNTAHYNNLVLEVWRDRESRAIAAEMAAGRLEPLGGRMALERLQVQAVREGGMVAVADTIDEVGQKIDDVLSGAKKDDVLLTGYWNLDHLSTGHRGGDTILISGKTSGGKTALAMNLAARYLSAGIPGAIFSIEMTRRSLEQRLISLKTGVAVRTINTPRGLSPEAIVAISKATDMIRGWPLWINDSGSLTDMEFISDMREMGRENGIRWAMVDYLQLMDMAGAGREVNRQEKVTHFSRISVEISKELGIPIYLLSQLNDDGKIRESRSPGHACRFHLQPEIKKPEGVKPLEDPTIWWPAVIHQYKGGDAGTGDANFRFYPATMTFEAEDG